MAPKELTEGEREAVENELAHVYAKEFVVPTDAMLGSHVASYAGSQEDARCTFNSYMHNFLTLNRDLRTDANGITTLLDNVPSVFALPEAGTECYYAFTANFDLNAKGTISILLKSDDRVRAYISDAVKKPQASSADRTLEPSDAPVRFTPFRQYRSDNMFQGNNFEDMADRPPVSHKKGQIIDKQVYLTVRAEAGPAHGRLHVKTDVTMS